MAANASNGSEGKFSGMPLQQGKGGKRLVFDKLRLEGFGLYRGPAEFRFVPGINIFAAQNESGKTSMVSGLAAVIFGLPHRQGAADTFNLERFRNWDRPAACRGELVFTVFGGGDKNHVGGDGKTYLIERDFDNHQVSLWEIEGEPGGGESPRKKLLLEGQHNPAARKPLEAYDDYLAGMFGIAARELFQETFYITQPLPETRQIGASLQGLLTGGGGRPFHDALEAIAGDLKDITKLTGPNDRGITPRNMGRDGELEKLEDILLKREGEINAGRETADALAGVNRMYNEADSELKAKQKLLEQKNKVLEAWASWQLAAEKYAAASKERENIKRDYDAALELSKKKADILSHIETHYAEFRAADDVEDSLEKIIDLETRVSSLNEKIVGFDNERKSAAEDKERLEGELRLHEKWDGLGPEPVEKLNGLRRDAEIYQEKWNSFITASKRLEELEAALTEKFSLLQDADDRTILMLENFSEERMRLETEKAKANDLNRSAAEAVNEYEQEKALFDKRYGDLAQLPEGASAAAVDKCILLKKKDELQDTIERSKRTPVFKAAAYAGVFLALAGLIVTILMMTGAVTFSTKFKAYSGAALAASTIFTLLMASFTAAAIFKGVRHKRRAQLPLLEEYIKVTTGIKNADLLLGTLADHDGIELARTAERLDRKKEEQDRIGELSKKAGAADLVKLKTDLDKAASHLREFHDSTKIYTEAFPDIKEALKEWAKIKREKSELKAEVAAYAESSFGCRPEMAREAVIAGPDVKEGINNDGPRIKDSRLYETALMINALDPGGFGNNPDADNDPVASVSVSASASTIIRVGDFMDLLAGLSGGWWDEQKDMAAATVGLRKEKAAAEQRENAAVTRLAEENKEAGKQQSLLKEYRERLAAILEKSQGNAACALEKCRKYKELTAEMAAFDIRHQALLKNHEAGDEAGLKACLERAGDETAGFMIKWREITEKNPGLPSPRDAADPEKVRQKMDDLNASVDEIEENLDGLKEKRDDLYRRLARLEGSDPINIAAAELDLAELRNKKYKLKLQADALTEAYKELDAAIAEYRNTYRNRLEDKATAYYKQVMAERNIVLDEELVLGIREKGRPVSLFHLSKGARDQLYISLRFAVADLLAESVRLPMIFDDPFVSTDSARLAAFRKIMEEEAAGRQFILLAHSDSYREWGNPVDIR